MVPSDHAISQTVQPGDVVLDLGTGSGILALFACQAGATRVYAVDRTDGLHLARKLVQDNGFSDRVVLMQNEIRSLELPEMVDGIISELISKAVVGQQQEALISRCRDRFLKPGGWLLPQIVSLCIAPVQAEEVYQELQFPPQSVYSLNFASANRLALHHPHSARLDPSSFLAPPQVAYCLVG